MFMEAAGIVLGQHRHFLDMGIGHIAQGKINAAVAPCDRHGAHGALMGQFPHFAVISAG